jgi:hypothetical protein
MRKISKLVIFSISLAILGWFFFARDTLASVKLQNALNVTWRVERVSLNGRLVNNVALSIPPNSAQQYSPMGHLTAVQVSSGDLLSITSMQSEGPVTAQCTVPTLPKQQACLVIARYDGGQGLTCWKDCW